VDSTELTIGSQPAARDDLTVVELDGEAVVYDPKSGHLHHLNATATVVFALMDGTATVQESVDAISKAFAVRPEVIESDVLAILRGFAAADLIDTSASE
jgi:Coenzyme PQQ synthesis protein D (PqqD)